MAGSGEDLIAGNKTFSLCWKRGAPYKVCDAWPVIPIVRQDFPRERLILSAPPLSALSRILHLVIAYHRGLYDVTYTDNF